MSQTHPRLCQPHMCFHLVWLYGFSFTSIASEFCHHFVLLHLNACLSVVKTAFGFGSQAHPTALHMGKLSLSL